MKKKIASGITIALQTSRANAKLDVSKINNSYLLGNTILPAKADEEEGFKTCTYACETPGKSFSTQIREI